MSKPILPVANEFLLHLNCIWMQEYRETQPLGIAALNPINQADLEQVKYLTHAELTHGNTTNGD